VASQSAYQLGTPEVWYLTARWKAHVDHGTCSIPLIWLVFDIQVHPHPLRKSLSVNRPSIRHISTPPRIFGGAQARKRSKRHCDPQSASRRGRVPQRRQRHFESARGLISLIGRRSSGGYDRFGSTASAVRIVFFHIYDPGVNLSNAMRAADAVTPNLAYPPEERLPATEIKPLARSKCRRRCSSAPPCRRHARGGGCFPVLLPVRARNRLWFGPTWRFRVGRYMANRRSINLTAIPQSVYSLASTPDPTLSLTKHPLPRYEAGSAYRIQPYLRSNARAVDRSLALKIRYSDSDGLRGHRRRWSVPRSGQISRQFH